MIPDKERYGGAWRDPMRSDAASPFYFQQHRFRALPGQGVALTESSSEWYK